MSLRVPALHLRTVCRDVFPLGEGARRRPSWESQRQAEAWCSLRAPRRPTKEARAGQLSPFYFSRLRSRRGLVVPILVLRTRPASLPMVLRGNPAFLTPALGSGRWVSG